VATMPAEKKYRYSPAALEKTFARVLLCLRLSKRPEVWTTEISVWSDHPFRSSLPFSYQPFHATGFRGEPLFWSPEDLYLLSSDDVPLFQKFFGRFASSNPALWKSDIACENYLRAFELQHSPSEMLLRSWAGLESILIPERRNIRELAARRISRLLGATRDDRDMLSEQTKACYRARSEVAHGSRPGGDTLSDAWQAFELLQAVLRTLIVKFPDLTLAEIDKL
jgi:hypothetical protein